RARQARPTMMRVFLFALFACTVAACEIKDEVGVDCDTILASATPIDCTAGQPSCNFTRDCPSPKVCNVKTRRCFLPTDRCVGTPCVFESDCAAHEACNLSSGLCFDTREPQSCRPCLSDSDCGRTTCEVFRRQCR